MSPFRGLNGSDRVRFGSDHIILLFFYSDPNLTQLNSGQKTLTHARPDGSRVDPCKIINVYLSFN
jgi:hypothetical protein